MDNVTKEKRSQIMSKIRGNDTKPEILIRKMLFGLGYRYRKNVKGLPGTPDLVFPQKKKVVFIHGCFWHYHNGGCNISHIPKSRSDYWKNKFKRNVERDQENSIKLKNLGWDIMVIWECEVEKLIQNPGKLSEFLNKFN